MTYNDSEELGTTWWYEIKARQVTYHLLRKVQSTYN